MKRLFVFLIIIFISLTSYAQKSEVNVLLKQENRLTARGNDAELLLKAMVQYKDGGDVVDLQSIKLNLDGTTRIADVAEVKVYTSGLEDCDNNRFYEEASLIGSCSPKSGDFICELNGQLLKIINLNMGNTRKQLNKM